MAEEVIRMPEGGHGDSGSLSENPDLRFLSESVHNLVEAFSSRASKVKEKLEDPPTSESEERGSSSSDSPVRTLSVVQVYQEETTRRSKIPALSRCGTWLLRSSKTIQPQGKVHIAWLFLVALAFVYNAVSIPLCAVFPVHIDGVVPIWLLLSCFADVIYLLDATVFQIRVRIIKSGSWIEDPKLLAQHHVKEPQFWMDVLSLLPLDVMYLFYGTNPMWRLPRFLKVRRFWEFFDRSAAVFSLPYLIRIARTLLYMVYLIHLNACAYYAISAYEGIGSNDFVYDGLGVAYVRCFFFATKTATSIGKNPKPGNEVEYLFMIASWLLGVFIFASLIGQVRDIVATASKQKMEYTKMMDQIGQHMNTLKVSKTLQNKVKLWLSYTWKTQKTLDEKNLLSWLPLKLQRDIALNVHMNTLKKVKLFQDCGSALLRDLVLKLRPVLYLPGDYICKKGEVGKEMYIVKMGELRVMGGDHGDVLLSTLKEGSVFGEISLLSTAGGNRRTATVIVFVLSKEDLNETIRDYPEAQRVLQKKASKLMKQGRSRERTRISAEHVVPFRCTPPLPRLFHVVQAARPAVEGDAPGEASRRGVVLSCERLVRRDPASSDGPRCRLLPVSDLSGSPWSVAADQFFARRRSSDFDETQPPAVFTISGERRPRK